MKFGFGVIKGKKYNDSSSAETAFTLTNDWKQYSIDLAGKDLSCIKSGFDCVVTGEAARSFSDLDDVRYEK